MTNNKILDLKKLEDILTDPLTELLRNGARKLIAVETELQELLDQYSGLSNEQGRTPPDCSKWLLARA